MTAALLGLRFLLELAALAGLAWWGAGAALVAAVLAPLAFAAAWGLFVAPKAKVQLEPSRRLAVEIVLFGLAAAAIGAAGGPALGAAYGAVAVADGLALRALERR